MMEKIAVDKWIIFKKTKLKICDTNEFCLNIPLKIIKVGDCGENNLFRVDFPNSTDVSLSYNVSIDDEWEFVDAPYVRYNDIEIGSVYTDSQLNGWHSFFVPKKKLYSKKYNTEIFFGWRVDKYFGTTITKVYATQFGEIYPSNKKWMKATPEQVKYVHQKIGEMEIQKYTEYMLKKEKEKSIINGAKQHEQ